jgi:hypothetical protein
MANGGHDLAVVGHLPHELDHGPVAAQAIRGIPPQG